MRPNSLRKGAIFARFGGVLSEFLERSGILLSHKEQAVLLQAVGEAVTQANEQLRRRTRRSASASAPGSASSASPTRASCPTTAGGIVSPASSSA